MIVELVAGIGSKPGEAYATKYLQFVIVGACYKKLGERRCHIQNRCREMIDEIDFSLKLVSRVASRHSSVR